MSYGVRRSRLEQLEVNRLDLLGFLTSLNDTLMLLLQGFRQGFVTGQDGRRPVACLNECISPLDQAFCLSGFLQKRRLQPLPLCLQAGLRRTFLNLLDVVSSPVSFSQHTQDLVSLFVTASEEAAFLSRLLWRLVPLGLKRTATRFNLAPERHLLRTESAQEGLFGRPGILVSSRCTLKELLDLRVKFAASLSHFLCTATCGIGQDVGLIGEVLSRPCRLVACVLVIAEGIDECCRTCHCSRSGNSPRSCQ